MKPDKKPAKYVFLTRTICHCVAQKHYLINNCLGCGKVVCVKEGEGPCFYCGRIVTKPDGQFYVRDDVLFPSLSKEEQLKAYKYRSLAVQHTAKLVYRDQSFSENQNIFDEQLDYYDVTENKWIDEEDRKKAIERILEKKQFVREEYFKVNVKYDPITEQFIREEFHFDEEAFKKEGQEFMREKEKEDYAKKTAKAKHNWDQRVVHNDKIRDLCAELLHQDNQEETVYQKPVIRPVQNRVVELIIEE